MISLLLWFLAFYTQETGCFVAALCWMLFAWERHGRRAALEQASFVYAHVYALEQHLKRNNCAKLDLKSKQTFDDVKEFLNASSRD